MGNLEENMNEAKIKKKSHRYGILYHWQDVTDFQRRWVQQYI